MPSSEFKAHQESTATDARARARVEIASRIRRVCAGLAEPEFAALVDRMAGLQCKYEQIGGAPTSLHQILQSLSGITPTQSQRKIV